MAINLETDVNPEKLNLAENVDTDTLEDIGRQLKAGYEADEDSRKQWILENEGWLKLAAQYRETKTFPWPHAANVKYPLVTTAAMQFAARAYPALLPNKKPVKAVVIGEEDETLNQLSNAVAAHMNYQFMYEMPDWEEDMDKLCMILPITGTVFKKTWYNPVKKQNVSSLVLAKDLVVNYWTKNIAESPRISHIIELNNNEIEERIRKGVFLDVKLGEPVVPQNPNTRNEDITKMKMPSVVDYTTPHTLVECHTWWDLDEDGYAEPYIITFELNTAKVLRIVPRFYMEDIEWSEDEGKNKKILSIKATQYFTKFGFIPNPDGGFYDLGFGLLLGTLNDTINTSINQLLDAGTLSTLQAGFLGKGIRIKGGEYRMAPNEWKVVNATVDDLRKAIYPLPVKEPSTVLFQLLGTLVTSGKELASISEIFVGKMPGQNTPATTTLETVKQGMAVFTAIYKRIYRSLDQEFKKLFELNRFFLDNVQDYPIELTTEAYQMASITVIPTADPDAASDAEKLVKAQALMELAKAQLVNPQVATVRLLQAMRIEGIEELMNLPQQENPEVQKMQMEMQIKQQEFELKMQVEQQKLEVQKIKVQLDIEKAKMEMAIKQQDQQQEMQYKEQMAALDMQLTQQQGQLDMYMAAQQAQSDKRLMDQNEQHQSRMMQQKEQHTQAMGEQKIAQTKAQSKIKATSTKKPTRKE